MAVYPPFACSLFERPGNGTTLAYKVLGRTLRSGATPLVLVHGLSAVGLVDWLPLAESLAESRPVLIFDHRGIGASSIAQERREEAYSAHDLADDVVELVKHVGWREIDLLGFSMGGMIAQQILVTPRLPFMIRHAVLVATSAKPAHSDLLAAIAPPSSRPQTVEDKIALVTPLIHLGYDPSFLKDPKNSALINRRVLESVHTRRPSKTIGHQLDVIAGYDVRKQLSSIPPTLPVLVLHGTLDRTVYYSEHTYILKGIKHAILLSFDIGHTWYDYFSTEYWVELLTRFLADKDVEALVPPQKSKL